MFIGFKSVATVLVVLLALDHQVYANSLNEVAEILPAGTNIVTVVDCSVLNESDWAKDNDVQIEDLVGAPENAKHLVIAAELDFEYWSPSEQLALVKFDTKFSDHSTRQNDDVFQDSVDGHVIGWLERRIGVLQLDDESWVVAPDRSRQSLARWIRTHVSKPNAERSSVFLRYAVNEATKQRNLAVIAMDLRDSIDKSTVNRIVNSQSELDQNGSKELASLLASIEGTAITIRATDELSARVQVRFENDANPLKGKTIQLVDTILRNIGARLDDIEKWKSVVDENVVSLEGPISISTLEDLLSLTVLDSQLPSHVRALSKRLVGKPTRSDPNERSTSEAATSEAKTTTSMAQNAKRDATEKFLTRFQRLLSRLHRRTDESLIESRFWLDRYAFKIQYLDRDDVDEELLQLADETTRRLRSMAKELENAIVEAAEEIESEWTATPTYETVNYGGIRVRRRAWFYGGSDWGNDPRFVDRLQVRNMINDAITSVKSAGISIVREYNETGTQLANNYGFEFEAWNPGDLR